MKSTRIFLASIVLLFSFTAASAQNPITPTTPGMKLTYSISDGNDNVLMHMRQTVESVSDNFNGQKVVILIDILNKDMQPIAGQSQKQEFLLTRDRAIASKDVFAPPAQPGLDVQVVGDDVEYSLQPFVGENLPEYIINIIMSAQGQTFEFSIMSLERKVTAVETIETEAGSFTCFIIREVVEQMAMGETETSTEDTWYANGIGTVREVSYAADGTVGSIVELISVERP